MKGDLDPALLADLLKQSMASGQLPYLTIVSSSMAPLLQRGDQVRLEPATVTQLQVGDIVAVAGPFKLVTHRYWGCLEETGQQLITRGDRLIRFDQPEPAEKLVGRVTIRRRRQQQLPLTDGPGRWLNRRLAALVKLELHLFGVPAAAELSKTPHPLLHRRGLMPYNGRLNLFVRLIRRLLRGWAGILTMLINLSANNKYEERSQ